jgi:hypothetical protein
LDTRLLSDGQHELTAVAYEGTHVRTTSRVSLPVLVQNSSLAAALIPVDLPETAPVTGTYHIRVVANQQYITALTLMSTGGQIGSSSNSANTVFTVNGASLGIGRHPFYALAESSSGQKYRTQTYWVRLTDN